MNNNNAPCHKPEIKKLNRISGQIEGIKKMIEDGRYCPDILTQLRAARAAIKSIETNILETHLQSCVKDAMIGGNKSDTSEKIDEILKIFKRYNNA